MPVPISSVLEKLCTDHHTDTVELAEIAGVNLSTISRWLCDNGRPNFAVLNAWARLLPSETARVAVMNAIASDTGMIVIAGDRSLDVNGDGKVDLMDALAALGDALRTITPEIERITAAVQAGNCPSEYGPTFTAQASAAMSALHTAERIVRSTPATTAMERKRARRPGAAGGPPLEDARGELRLAQG